MFNPIAAGGKLLKTGGARVHRKAKKLYEILAGLTPKLTVGAHNYELIRLGTGYGGWTFVDSRDLYNTAIVAQPSAAARSEHAAESLLQPGGRRPGS